MHSRSDYTLIIALIPGNEKPFGVILFIIISQIFDRIRSYRHLGMLGAQIRFIVHFIYILAVFASVSNFLR